MRYGISFKGKRCEDYGLFVVTRPNIPAPVRDIELIKIPGKSGVMVRDNERYEPIEIQVEFNFLSKPDKWNETFRDAIRWMSGAGELELSDDGDYFYKVYSVQVSEGERTIKRIGRFTAQFTCDPYAYLKNGKKEYELNEVLWNPYCEAEPIYNITGEGVCILTVNGKQMRANVGQNLVIDTGRMIAFRTDGTMQNTKVSGDYQDLYLQEGENSIAITSGFTLKVIPNWRSI